MFFGRCNFVACKGYTALTDIEYLKMCMDFASHAHFQLQLLPAMCLSNMTSGHVTLH